MEDCALNLCRVTSLTVASGRVTLHGAVNTHSDIQLGERVHTVGGSLAGWVRPEVLARGCVCPSPALPPLFIVLAPIK